MHNALFHMAWLVGQTGEQAPGGPRGFGDIIQNFWWFPAILVIMYLFMLRPQQKREKERKAMLSRVKRGDNVVTIGGVRGVVRSVGDAEVVICVDKKTKTELTVSRSAVGRIVEKGKEDSGSKNEGG